MTTSQVLMRRYRDVDVDHLLEHFVETLLDVEGELNHASEWQWDTVVREACQHNRPALPASDETEAADFDAPDLRDPYVIPFARPLDPK